MEREEHRVTIQAILLSPWAPFVIALAVFVPSIVTGTFVHDDLPQIARNPTVQSGGWRAALTRGYWANAAAEDYGFDPRGDLYRPLTTLSVMLSYGLYGATTWPYHLENVLLHAAVSALIVILLRRWSFDPRVASWPARSSPSLPFTSSRSAGSFFGPRCSRRCSVASI